MQSKKLKCQGAKLLVFKFVKGKSKDHTFALSIFISFIYQAIHPLLYKYGGLDVLNDDPLFPLFCSLEMAEKTFAPMCTL